MTPIVDIDLWTLQNNGFRYWKYFQYRECTAPSIALDPKLMNQKWIRSCNSTGVTRHHYNLGNIHKELLEWCRMVSAKLRSFCFFKNISFFWRAMIMSLWSLFVSEIVSPLVRIAPNLVKTFLASHLYRNSKIPDCST